MNASPIPEDCRIFLDGEPLPLAPDGSSSLVALSPFSISWGVERPWDDPTPAVLTLRLVDQAGLFTKSSGKLQGHRITVQPTWSVSYPSPVCYCVFDGFVTQVSIDAASSSRQTLTVTASDRLYILRTDRRKGPTDGTTAQAARGFQWWMQGSIAATISRWLAFDGIRSNEMPFSNFSAPLESSVTASFVDWAKRLLTRKPDGKYVLDAGRLFAVTYQSDSTEQVPCLTARSYWWDVELVLMGPSIVTGDDGTNIRDDWRVLDAADIIIDSTATLSMPTDFYTQLEFKYCHRGLTNPGASQDQQAQAATTYTFTHDGSRTTQIETASREGDSALSLEADWTEYPNTPESLASAIDMSPAISQIRESNRRLRIPTPTLRSDRVSQLSIFPRPFVFIPINSRYERSSPSTHGAWLAAGGTLTYDSTSSKGRWSHELKLFPAYSTVLDKSPTCLQMKELDSSASFADCDWTIGALRYITTIGK